MRITHALHALVIAALCFGGTFTCKSHSGNRSTLPAAR
jgi:hypothetical protein